MNKAAQKFAQVTALNGVKICHRSIGETSKPAVLMIMGIAAARKSTSELGAPDGGDAAARDN